VAANDPYEILGLPASAGDADIKAAYLAAVRAHPPEREPETFKTIRAAYERLKTPELRLETDMLRIQPWPCPAPAGSSEGAGTRLAAPRIEPQDIVRAARAFTDLGRRDFPEDFRNIKD
jgi:curved DNA-binding protein CbpA